MYENTTFYLPTFMDFRGRIYPLVNYLSYQGSDIARSLIEFSEGCILNDNDFKVALHYLANTAGKSKLTINNKIKWSREFINKINNNFFIGEQDNIIINNDILDVVNNSDEPAQFLSVLISILNANNNSYYKFPYSNML